MNGINIYLKAPITEKIAHGHINFIGTPWALTAVADAQFWPNFKSTWSGNGKIADYVEVIISEWFQDGINGAGPASTLPKDQLFSQVLAQINQSIPNLILQSNVYEWILDPDIVQVPSSTGKQIYINTEPLLVNGTGTWQLRPNASGQTELGNFLVAGDFVQAPSDLACTETANSSGKGAVNSILLVDKIGPPIPIYPPYEPTMPLVPDFYKAMRDLDVLDYFIDPSSNPPFWITSPAQL